MLAGAIAFAFAYWRAKVADRQATAAQHQAETARLQTEISQRAWLDDRYERSANLLGSDALSLRLGGIYALQRLAEEHPDQCHVQIMRLFCAFARHPTAVARNGSGVIDYETGGALDANESVARLPRLRPDVQAVIEAIATLNEARILLEREAEYVPNLSDADLRNLRLDAQNLSRVELVGADLSGARLYRTNFSHAKLYDAILSCARLNGADFSNAKVDDANLSGVTAGIADFSDVYFFNGKFGSSRFVLVQM